jgi:hypothetical protein
MSERHGPDWRLIERIVLIIEMIINILERFNLL